MVAEIPGKFRVIKRLLQFDRDSKLTNCEKGMLLDVGGINLYYDSLRQVFPEYEISLMNISASVIGRETNSLLGDAMKMPFSDQSWDIITSFDLIEHLTSPDRFLEEAFRVLKPNGLLIISTPNLADAYSRISLLLGHMPFSYVPSEYRVATPMTSVAGPNAAHKSVFTYKGFRQLLEIHGFKSHFFSGFCYADSYEKSRWGKVEKTRIDQIRRLIDRFLPPTMKEGMVFIASKPSDSAGK